MRMLIRRFLELAPRGEGEGASRQVLVLGAGFDTAAFQLQREGALAGSAYFELDFADVVREKSRIVREQRLLCGSLCGPAAGGEPLDGRIEACPDTGELTVQASADSGRYCLRAVDLRQLECVRETLMQAGFDTALPTLVVAECVLIYMEAQHSDALIEWVGSSLPRAAFLVYEQIRPHDPFGRMMVGNIAARGCPLRSIGALLACPASASGPHRAALRAAQYPDLEDVCGRFRSRGWDWAVAQDMDAVYRHVLDADEKARTERLEMFDEFEEWHMLMQHYCLLYACTDGASDAPDGQTAGDPPAARGSWLRDVALAVAQTEQSGRVG